MARKAVICECTSNGIFLVRDCIDQGLDPVVVYPPLPAGEDDFAGRMRRIAEQRIVDLAEVIRPADMDDLVSRLEGYDIACVIAGSEYGIPYADRLSSILGLPGNDPSTTPDRTDKLHMHRALERAGLRHIRTVPVRSEEDVTRFWSGKPVIVKPSASVATIGVHLCQTLDECLEAYREDRGTSGWTGGGVGEIMLQDYIDGKLDNRHVFRLGSTPEVMQLVGAKDLPLDLTASVLATKEAKHNLNIESLKKLPEELADPIAIFQSAQIPNGLLVITEIPDTGSKKIAVAVHLDKTRNRNRINDIRSIHGRSDFNMQTQVDMGLLRYVNTKRRPHSLRLNRVAPVSGSVNKTFNKNKIFTESDLSQAEKDNISKLRRVNPKMTKASAETTEAFHINDLSHQGTVPLPEANGPTSKDSAIPDSRQLSMNAESEISPASQEKIGKIKSKIEAIQKKFNRKAKVKSALGVVETVKEAREILGAESLPYNAKGINTGNKIIVIAQNIEDSADAARVFLHEKVGHFGLRNLLGKDFDPFLEYVAKHYKGSNAWNKIRELYGNAAPTDRVVAEELLAHL